MLPPVVRLKCHPTGEHALSARPLIGPSYLDKVMVRMSQEIARDTIMAASTSCPLPPCPLLLPSKQCFVLPVDVLPPDR